MAIGIYFEIVNVKSDIYKKELFFKQKRWDQISLEVYEVDHLTQTFIIIFFKSVEKLELVKLLLFVYSFTFHQTSELISLNEKGETSPP